MSKAHTWKIRNIDTKTDFAMDGYLQQFSNREFAEQHRDRLIVETGQRHWVLPIWPATVGNPKGGRLHASS